MSAKNMGLLLLVGGILAVPAMAAWVYPHPVTTEVVPPDTTKEVQVTQSSSESAPVVAAEEPEEDQPVGDEPDQLFCLWGASKNLCDGTLRYGDWAVTQCGDCINLVGYGAQLKVQVQHNATSCTTPASIHACDDTRELVGVLVGEGDFRIRLNEPCPVRGWWQMSWDLHDPSVVVPIATGWLDGTLGTGTHRVPACISSTPDDQRCGDECERCYMAELIDTDPPRWIIHTEGSMVGRVTEGEYADCLVRVTMQGFFVAPASDDGMPIPPNAILNGWSFCGTVDGVLDCPCK